MIEHPAYTGNFIRHTPGLKNLWGRCLHDLLSPLSATFTCNQRSYNRRPISVPVLFIVCLTIWNNIGFQETEQMGIQSGGMIILVNNLEFISHFSSNMRSIVLVYRCIAHF
jgi:hypothetical protein